MNKEPMGLTPTVRSIEDRKVLGSGAWTFVNTDYVLRSDYEELFALLRKHGGHTANCAYLQWHSAPVSTCDCGWTNLVPLVHGKEIKPATLNRLLKQEK